MIEAAAFLAAAQARGLDFYTGVPCSFLTPLINRVISDPGTTYVAGASEGEAVAIAAGAWLAGRETVVMCQNSGLGNTVNPLTSLNYPFRIPTLLVVTWRGGPGVADEPQHELMGEITPALLDVLRVPHEPFPARDEDIAPRLDAARAHMRRTGLPAALILERGAVADEPLAVAPFEALAGADVAVAGSGGAPAARHVVLERLLASIPDRAAVIATTGKCGRELFTLADREQHLYQVGSMGCAAAMGLGVALHTERPVIVLDGDGAALMKLGTLATVGAYRPPNLIHVLLDNAVHDSTGGQPTVSPGVDFAAVAAACGYRGAYRCAGVEGFEAALGTALAGAGPHFLHVPIAPGSMAQLGRPTVRPSDVARRFRAFLAGG